MRPSPMGWPEPDPAAAVQRLANDVLAALSADAHPLKLPGNCRFFCLVLTWLPDQELQP